MTPRPVPATRAVKLGDHRLFPGSRVYLTCSLCGWSRDYSAERMILRLRQLRTGGHDTPVASLAGRVAWNCPGCGRTKWRMELAWPAGMDEREIKRLASAYRN